MTKTDYKDVTRRLEEETPHGHTSFGRRAIREAFSRQSRAPTLERDTTNSIQPRQEVSRGALFKYSTVRTSAGDGKLFGVTETGRYNLGPYRYGEHENDRMLAHNYI